MSIHYQKDAQNIVTLTVDTDGKTVNLINQTFFDELRQALDRFGADAAAAGVIMTSAKSAFIAGGDIDAIFRMRDPKETFEFVEGFKALIRRLETNGKPVVAALNGTALGGGLEIALACHYRVAINDPRARFGLPEVTLGLLPGGGGLTRMTRLLGLQAAFPFLMEGTQVNPLEAQQAGILHALAADRAEMMEMALAWILRNPQAAQPWDQIDYKMPGGDPSKPHIAQMISVAPALLMEKTHGNYPAPIAILNTMVDGALVDFDTASRIESRAFTALATGQTSKNILQSAWYQLNEINNGRSRPSGIGPQPTKRLGILGAGLMGHGIACVSAMAGIDVVLKDVSEEAAQTGKANVEKILDGRVRQRKLSNEEKFAILARITPTTDLDDLRGCDLIIEAVFENRALKGRVTQEAEARIDADAVFGTNTSTLPISGLAEMSARPENYIGIHFFSPVHKMRLVEIIRGRHTSPRALAKAFDFALKIRKTPIVVNDGRGFYTSRVFTTFVNEGLALLAEGQSPRAIEMAALQAGMPVGPLAVADEVNLGLALHIREQTRKDLAEDGKEMEVTPADRVLALLVNDKMRSGKAQGAGFYDYPVGGKKRLWPGLREIFPPRSEQLPAQEMIDRMMFIQVLETVRCQLEGVIDSVGDANIGSIFGWGFAPFKGGTLQFIRDYGVMAFIERSGELAAAYGPRFEPPPQLLHFEAGQLRP